MFYGTGKLIQFVFLLGIYLLNKCNTCVFYIFFAQCVFYPSTLGKYSGAYATVVRYYFEIHSCKPPDVYGTIRVPEKLAFGLS